MLEALRRRLIDCLRIAHYIDEGVARRQLHGQAPKPRVAANVEHTQRWHACDCPTLLELIVRRIEQLEAVQPVQVRRQRAKAIFAYVEFLFADQITGQ